MAGDAPALVALENVTGFLRANDRRDFKSVVTALVSAGYRVGALMMDARDFVPQARERMILVAVRGETHPAVDLVGARHDPRWQLNDVLDTPRGADQRWLASANVTEMLTKVTGQDVVRLDEARRAGRRFAATTSVTRRDTVAGRVRVRTVRSDGRSGCLLARHDERPA